MQVQASCFSYASCAPTGIAHVRHCFCGGGDTIFGSACGCGGRASFADFDDEDDDSSGCDDSSNLGPCACPCHHLDDCQECSGCGSDTWHGTWQCECDCAVSGSRGGGDCNPRRRMHAEDALEVDAIALDAVYGDESEGAPRRIFACCVLHAVCCDVL